MRRTALLTLIILLGTPLCAQENGYRLEAGIGGGGSFYMGDANTRMYSSTNGAAALMFRYNVNPRFSTRAAFSAAGISGSSRGAFGELPIDDEIRFSRTVYDMSVQVEWGFMSYSPVFMADDRWAPYGLAGIGTVCLSGQDKDDWALCLPLGLGIRYRLAPRVNIGLEWSMRFTNSDRLDVSTPSETDLHDPMRIKGKGMKNNDSYCLTMVYLSFDLFEKPCNCNDGN